MVTNLKDCWDEGVLCVEHLDELPLVMDWLVAKTVDVGIGRVGQDAGEHTAKWGGAVASGGVKN